MSSSDQTAAVAVDSSNEVIAIGHLGHDYPTVKYSSAGIPPWANRHHGAANGEDVAVAAVIGASHNVMVTGYSGGTLDPHIYDSTAAPGPRTMSGAITAPESSGRTLRTSHILTLALASTLAALGPGCMAPETARTWVAYHATIQPPSPEGGWNAGELAGLQESLAASAGHCGLKPTSEFLGPDWLGLGKRRNDRAVADLAAGKTDTFCYLAEYSKGSGVRVKAYYVPFLPGDYGGMARVICVDYTYLKTAPITPPEEQQADAQWATIFEALNARFHSRLEAHQDKLLRRHEYP